MAGDLYKALTADDSCARKRAASALIKHLLKSEKESAWDEAYEKIVKGLKNPNSDTRMGYAEALTHFLIARGSDNIDIQGLIKRLPSGTQEKKGYTTLADAALLSVNIMFDAGVLDWKTFTLDDFKALLDYIFTILPENEKFDPDFAFTQSLFLHICVLVQLLEGTNVKFEDSLEYILAKIDKQNLTLSPCAIPLYLLASPKQGLKFGCFSNGWRAGNPLARDNFSTLKNVLQSTIPNSSGVPANRSKDNTKSKSKKEKSKDKSSKPTLKFPFVWQKIIHAYSKTFGLDTGATSPKKPKSEKTDKKLAKSKKNDNSEVEVVGFETFWKILIDDNLFSHSSSIEQRLIGIEILHLSIPILKNAPASILKCLFTPNLIQALTSMKQQSKIPKELSTQFFDSVKSLSSTIIEISKSSSTFPVVVLESIYSSNRSYNFDQATKTKTVSELFNSLNAESVHKLVLFFSKVMLDPFEHDPKLRKDSQLVESRRKLALERITSLLKSPHLLQDANSEWLDDLLDLFILHGFFQPITKSSDSKKDTSKESKKRKHEENSAISAEKAVLSDPVPALSKTFISLLQERTASIVASSVVFKRADGISWPYRALSKLTKLEASDSGYTCLVEFSGEILKQKNKTLSTLERIRNKRQSSPHADTPQLSAFEMLFSLVLFQLYSGDTESAGVLDELQSCYNSIQGQSEAEEGGDENQDDDDDAAVDPTVVLTEILLSFIARESTSLRKISETVWKTFSAQVTRASLQRLYEVLAAQESSDGQSSLFDNFDADEYYNEDEKSSDEEDDDEEDDSDDEEDEEDDGSDSDESDEEEENDEKESTREQIEMIEDDSRHKLALALGLKGGEDNDVDMKEQSNSSSDDDSDDDNISMSDEQMKLLDEQLGAIFRERRNALLEHSGKTKERRKDNKVARHNIILFKNRVVDLLEIYVKQQGSESPLILTMINPLLYLVKTTTDKGLGEKITAFLKRDVCKVKITDKMVSNLVRDDLDINIEDKNEDEDEDEDENMDNAKDSDDSDEDAAASDVDMIPETNANSDVTASNIITWIKEIHSLAQVTKINALGQCCNQASVFLSKLLLQVDESYLDNVLQIYTETLKNWILHRQSKVTVAMFNDFINWVANYRQRKDANEQNTHLADEEKKSVKSKNPKKNESNGNKRTKNKNKKNK